MGHSAYSTAQHRLVAVSEGSSHIEHRDLGLGSTLDMADHHVGVSRLQRKGNLNRVGVSQLKYSDDFESAFKALIKKIEALPSGRNVFIYCEMGCHRSSFLSAAVLMASSRCSAGDVISFVKRMRPIVDFAKSKDDDHFCGHQTLSVVSEFVWAVGNSIWPSPCHLPRALEEEQWKTAWIEERRQPQE